MTNATPLYMCGYVALLLYPWVVWERFDAVAPCLLLGFALSNGSKPEGEERGAEQQSMRMCVWVDRHGG